MADECAAQGRTTAVMRKMVFKDFSGAPWAALGRPGGDRGEGTGAPSPASRRGREGTGPQTAGRSCGSPRHITGDPDPKS